MYSYISTTLVLHSKIRGTQSCFLELMLRVFTSTAPTTSSAPTNPSPGVESETSRTARKRLGEDKFLTKKHKLQSKIIFQTYLMFLLSLLSNHWTRKQKFLNSTPLSSELTNWWVTGEFYECLCNKVYQKSCSCHLYILDITVVYWEPWPVHEEEEGGFHRGATDEGSGQRGEGQKKGLSFYFHSLV